MVKQTNCRLAYSGPGVRSRAVFTLRSPVRKMTVGMAPPEDSAVAFAVEHEVEANQAIKNQLVEINLVKVKVVEVKVVEVKVVEVKVVEIKKVENNNDKQLTIPALHPARKRTVSRLLHRGTGYNQP
jgi:hypothetical protein